jgi:hypothetical protein
MRRSVASLALALLFLAPPASAGTVERPLPVNKFTEVNLNLTVGQRVAWSIAIAPDTELAVFDIHTHAADGSTVTLQSGIVNRTADGTFTLPGTGTFSWFVYNGLSRRDIVATITTDVLPPDQHGLPGPALPMVAAALALAAGLRARRAR